MTAPIVALSGKIKSGKTTVAHILGAKLGWRYYSFGEYVRSVAVAQGKTADRTSLQDVGQWLVEERPDEFVREVLDRAGWSPGTPLILDGLRHVEILQVLKEAVSPQVVLTVFLDVQEEERKTRIAGCTQPGSGAPSIFDGHPAEVQCVDRIPRVADLRVDSGQPLELVVREIANWLERFGREEGGG